jgi:hypothetical protein
MTDEYTYDFEKARYYTEEMVDLARRRWGEVPLSPKTMTWGDGTVSVIVRHTPPGGPQPMNEYVEVTLDFHEDGTTLNEGPTVREVVETGVGRNHKVESVEVLSTELIDLYD